MRLFIALCPPEETRRQLSEAIHALQMQGVGRFTKEENLHLTLAFLGETDRTNEAIDALSSISASPFTVTIERLGTFDDLLWAGAEPGAELTALQQELSVRLSSAGFSLEDRSFIPHITLVRRFSPKGTPDFTEAETALRRISWPVSAVTLMESCQCGGAHFYRSLYTKDLAQM